MIPFVTILEHYESSLHKKYSAKLLPGHLKAISAIKRCRTALSGEFHVQCTGCGHSEWHPKSCGHRSCPQCQNYEASEWLMRQQKKQLPVDYFMVTFTLPAQLRALTWRHQTVIYQLMFLCVSSTLKDFGLNPKNLGAEIGMTAVLHTHSRKLDYHPHIHVIIPGGGINKAKRQWIKTKGKYLFNEFALAKVFRARILDGLNAAKLPIPCSMPEEWVVDCKRVGNGEPALKYLSRYLYRGVISEKNIISDNNGMVTFRYTDGDTGENLTRSLKGEDLLWLVLQHVLPKGFHRVRDYGFLHSNAKKWFCRIKFTFPGYLLSLSLIFYIRNSQMLSFKWRHFEKEIILLNVRWYLAYPLSYRNLEEIAEERGYHVDHSTLNRWVITYAPKLEKEFHKKKRPVCGRWRMDETYIKVKGEWKYFYRAVDKEGNTIDFLLTAKRDMKAAKRFFKKAIKRNGLPELVNIDKSGSNKAALKSINKENSEAPKVDPIVIRQCKYLNNIIEQDHRNIKRITRPMLGFKNFYSAQKTLAGIELMKMIKKGQMIGGDGLSPAGQFYSLAA